MQNPTAQRAGGFTLIELLIVIAILGVLAAAFLPDLLGARKNADATTTLNNIQRLVVGVETFERKHHYYPPDDLQDPEKKLTFKSDNGTNTGIESLVAFLSQSPADGADLTDFGSRLTNTDGDDHGALLPLLGRKERLEVADQFDVPMAYFSATSNKGFERNQSVLPTPAGRPMTVKALRNVDGQVLGARKFQIVSAGIDGEFGTDDDLSYPENPGK